MGDELWDRQNKALGTFIRSQRELARLSLRQLSEMTDVSNAYLSQIERGLHEPSIRVIRSVARALGVAPEVLLSRAGLLGEEAAGEGEGEEPGPASAPSTEEAIRADPHLSDDEKSALIAVYRSYRSARS